MVPGVAGVGVVVVVVVARLSSTGMLPGSPCAATPPCSPDVMGREEECVALEYAVLSGDRRQLAGRYADGGGVVLDAASASYTHVSPRGEVVHHRVPFACSTHLPQLRVMLDLYNSIVDRPLLCVRSACYVAFAHPSTEPALGRADSDHWSPGYALRMYLRCAHVCRPSCI